MRYLLPVLLLASLGLAQIFGPAGVPLSWDFGITAFNSDSIFADYFSTSGATSYLSMVGDTLFFTRTGAAGDFDQVLCVVDESGIERYIVSDNGMNRWDIQGPVQTGPLVINGSTINVAGRVFLNYNGVVGYLQTSAALLTLTIDPNTTGSGTTIIGETGDNDITLINSRLRTNITTVDSTYVMGASDGYMFTMTANDTLKCPVTPLAGEVLECKFTNAAGGMVFGNGNNIDGATEVVASENDNIRIVWNATTSDWEIR